MQQRRWTAPGRALSGLNSQPCLQTSARTEKDAEKDALHKGGVALGEVVALCRQHFPGALLCREDRQQIVSNVPNKVSEEQASPAPTEGLGCVWSFWPVGCLQYDSCS